MKESVMKRYYFVRRCFLLLGVIFLVVLLSWLKFLYQPVITDPKGYRYIVKSGTAIRSVIDDWYATDIISHRVYFNFLIHLRGDGEALKAGEYFFPKGSTPSSMLNQMVTGRGMIYHIFTIIPGWRFSELKAALLQENFLYHALPKLSDEALMSRLGHKGLTPEGEFYPDTYYFAEGSSDLELLRRANKAMQSKLKIAWNKRYPNLPFKNAYQALIAASLIEKEAYLPSERPIIAGVLVNRLQRDMLLQFDPTVIYGLNTLYNGKLNKSDLLIETAYNTYLHKGLPPSPIAMPSMGSIMAAVNPDINTFFYFVARGDGSHQFSETLAEHNAAVIVIKKFNSNGFLNYTSPFEKGGLRGVLYKSLPTSLFQREGS